MSPRQWIADSVSFGHLLPRVEPDAFETARRVPPSRLLRRPKPCTNFNEHKRPQNRMRILHFHVPRIVANRARSPTWACAWRRQKQHLHRLLENFLGFVIAWSAKLLHVWSKKFGTSWEYHTIGRFLLRNERSREYFRTKNVNKPLKKFSHSATFFSASLSIFRKTSLWKENANRAASTSTERKWKLFCAFHELWIRDGDQTMGQMSSRISIAKPILEPLVSMSVIITRLALIKYSTVWNILMWLVQISLKATRESGTFLQSCKLLNV